MLAVPRCAVGHSARCTLQLLHGHVVCCAVLCSALLCSAVLCCVRDHLWALPIMQQVPWGPPLSIVLTF